MATNVSRSDTVRSFAYYASLIPRAATLLLMVIILIDMMAGVFFRYVVGQALPWSDEVGSLCLVWLCFIGGAVGINRGSHFSISLATEQLSPWGQRIVHAAVGLLIMILGAILTVAGLRLVQVNVTSEMPSLGISLSYQYGSALCGGLLTICYSAAYVVRSLRGQVTTEG